MHPFTANPSHQIPRIQLVLQLLDRLPCRLQNPIRHLIRHTDRRQPRTRQRRIKRQRHQLIRHLTVRPAHHDQTPRSLLPRRHRLVAQTRIPHQLVASILIDPLRQIAQHHHPLILHLQVRIAAVRLQLLARTVRRLIRRLDAIARKNHPRTLHLTHLRVGQRLPVRLHLQRCLTFHPLQTQRILRPQRHPRRERKRLIPPVLIPKRQQPRLLHHTRHILRRQNLTPSPRQPPLQRITRQILHMLLHILRANLRRRFRKVRLHRLRQHLLLRHLRSIQLQSLPRRLMIPRAQVNLRLPTRPASTRPSQLLPIRRKHRQAIKPIRLRHPHRITLPLRIHEVQFKIRKPLQVRREDQILTARMKIRRPTHCP